MARDFTAYFNNFYGVKGLYSSGRDVSDAEIGDALKRLKRVRPNFEFCGDSFDRELIRDMIFSESEQEKMYAIRNG